MNMLDIARTYHITPAQVVSLELAREQRRDIQREKRNRDDVDAAYEHIQMNPLPEYVA